MKIATWRYWHQLLGFSYGLTVYYGPRCYYGKTQPSEGWWLVPGTDPDGPQPVPGLWRE